MGLPGGTDSSCRDPFGSHVAEIDTSDYTHTHARAHARTHVRTIMGVEEDTGKGGRGGSGRSGLVGGWARRTEE